MPQFENIEILGRIFRTTISVISRRTSEAYANVIIGNAVRKLTEKYKFLNYVKINGAQYDEVYDIVAIESDINEIRTEEIIKAAKDFLKDVTDLMGKNAGFYFLKEIKDELPFGFEETIRKLGLDFDYLQLEFITEAKQFAKLRINNADLLGNIIKILFEILDRDMGRDVSLETMTEHVQRLSTEYQVLKDVKINDIRNIQNIDVVSVDPKVDFKEPGKVGAAIQRLIQEINSSYVEIGGESLIEKIKHHITRDYLFRMNEIGVDLDVIRLRKELVTRHVFMALIDVLSMSSNENFAVMIVNNVLKKFIANFAFLKYVYINPENSEINKDEVKVAGEMESVNTSELGRAIQRVIEDIALSLGEEAGSHFIQDFKKRLGKAYVLRIEEMGVNLHLIELKRNLTW